MKPEFEVLATPADVFTAAAEHVATHIGAAVAARGRCLLALSGGTTPRPLYERLAAAPYNPGLPWDRVHVFLADERHVPSGHPDSNYRLIRESLLEFVPIPPEQVHRVLTEQPPYQAAEAYSQVLHEVVGDDGLDLVVLGMGPDGHTASLFPGSPTLAWAERGAVATFVSALDSWRISLTLPELNHARAVLFVVTGATKTAALSDVRSGRSGLPAARVAPMDHDLVWLVDAATVGPSGETPSTALADIEDRKRSAAESAVALVVSGMVVGLGTGSTARYAVEAIGRRLATGQLTDVVGIPTSVATVRLARQHGVPLATLADHPVVDITIDGADEVAPNLDLIKGLGGALVREKIVATASRRLIIAVDDSKLVPQLGLRAPVPVAAVPFGWEAHLDWLRTLGAEPQLRRTSHGHPLVSDDGLVIIDCRFPGGIGAPTSLERLLASRPGLVASGLFLGLADIVFVASAAGVHAMRREGATASG